MHDRDHVRKLAEQSVHGGEPTAWFEALYQSAAGDTSVIPWADQRPNPNLLQWLDRHPVTSGSRALIVGCGLGDDAEEMARGGMRVTAFDIAPSAVAWCRRRFPATSVEYVVADALDPPAAWRGAYDFVLESYTLQALPPEPRQLALVRIAQTVAPGGMVLVICRGCDEGEDAGALPWPLTRGELGAFVTEGGFVEESFEDYEEAEDPPVRRFRCVFRKAADAPGHVR